MFNPARLEDTFEPSGFKPPGVKARAVKGHVFGFKLNGDERTALIAFLESMSSSGPPVTLPSAISSTWPNSPASSGSNRGLSRLRVACRIMRLRLTAPDGSPRMA